MNSLPKKYLSLVALSIGLSATHSYAQSLESIYQQALLSDPLLRQAAATFQSSQENINQAKATLRPTVTGQLDTKWEDNTASNNFNSQGYSINLTQPVYSPALNSGYNKVKISDDIAKLKYTQDQQNLITRTVDAYISAMIAKTELSTAKAQERAIKQRLDQVNAEFEVGIIAITDVHEAKASYDNARVNVIVSEGKLENSLESLQRLTNTQVSTVDILKKDYPIKNLSPEDPKHWIDLATENNIAILMAKSQIKSSLEDTNIAKSNRKPRVELQAAHSGTDNSSTGWNTNNKVALVLSVPLYNGGSLSSKVRQSISNQDIQKEIYQDTLRSTVQQTRSLVRDIQTNVLAISARKQSIVSSQAALDAVSEGFKAGTRNIVDILQAEQSLFTAKNNYATSRLEHIRLRFNLNFQTSAIEAKDIQELAQWMTEK